MSPKPIKIRGVGFEDSKYQKLKELEMNEKPVLKNNYKVMTNRVSYLITYEFNNRVEISYKLKIKAEERKKDIIRN